MRKRILSIVVLPVGLMLVSCADAGDTRARFSPTGLAPADTAPPAPGLSVPAEYVAAPPPAPAKEEPKDKKRGNTPPGTDRTGGGPASGAILDPAGVVTKEPVLREREAPR